MDKTTIIDGINVTPRADMVFYTDAAPNRPRMLVDCEIPEFAPFRALSLISRTRIACDVEVTGRTIQHKGYGAYMVRVKITWIEDDEPNQETRGWMYSRPNPNPTMW